MPKTIRPAPSISQALLPPMFISLVMWVVYKLDVLYRLNLFLYGVFPREVHGLKGILFTPLIHDTTNYYHVFENTLALVFFGTMLFYFYRPIAWRIIGFSWLLNGILVWTFAKPVYHVGMSGVIYALAFFMITGSILRKNRQLTGLNFLIIFLYGSIFWGLFPLVPQVSWESHVAGALIGILLGYLYRNTSPQHVHQPPPIEDDPLDDEPDAWWKTGVMKEKNENEWEIRYKYKPKKDADPPLNG